MSTPPRKLVHLDMDAFYAAVEQRDDPSLRGRPVVVGGSPSSRGVVATASYEARRYGIHSAMPAARAARLCPDAVFLRPDFARYKAVSRQLRAMFYELTDLVEPLSLDEAYLDVTEDKLGIGSATRVAELLRARIHDELGLTASAGVSSLKYVAKIASDHRKPDGLTVVPPEAVLDFVHPLPVRKLWGVGPATEARLRTLGVRTIGDLTRVDAADLDRCLGRHGRFLARLARGDDPREVRPHRRRKSCSAETTFAEDVDDLDELVAVLHGLAERVCRTLRAAELSGRTVSIKVRYDDFETITRSETLSAPTSDPLVLADVAARLLRQRTDAGRRPLRLVGCGLEHVGSPRDVRQLALPLG